MDFPKHTLARTRVVSKHLPMDTEATFSIPRIRTARLLLREHRVSDFDRFAEEVADPISRASPNGVMDRRTAWRSFVTGVGTWAMHGIGWWCVELAATGEFVGTVGAFYRESAIDGDGPPELELGWLIFRKYWQQGVATEAAMAALQHAFAATTVTHAIAHIHVTNEPSIRVATRLGMRHERDVDFYGAPMRRYVVPRAPQA
jgi:RimJ/RimL family protein N-acetyltransferase